MHLSLALALALQAPVPDCPRSDAPAVLASANDTVAAARAAWRGHWSARHVARWEPYRARLVDGMWHVFGTLPPGWRGGAPEARLCAADGRVVAVFHTE